MSGNTRKNQVTRLVTLRHRSTMLGALMSCHVRYLIRALRPCKRFHADSALPRQVRCPMVDAELPVLLMTGGSPGGTGGVAVSGGRPAAGEAAAGGTSPGLAPGRCGMPENGVMKDISAGRSGWPHLAWAMWLPCASAVVVGACSPWSTWQAW